MGATTQRDRWRSSWHSAARAGALFLGAFTAVNLAGGVLRAGFDQTIWWVDVRPLSRGGAALFLAAAAGFFLAFAAHPAARPWRRWITAGLATGLGLLALWDALSFWRLLAAGAVESRFPVPLSLFVAALLALIAAGVLRGHVDPPRLRPLVVAGVLAALALGLPLAQMVCFGHTDYRRDADAIVVLGAAVRADGSPSQALEDRVLTGCRLYHQGHAPVLVLSGGPGAGGHREVDTMRRIALEAGVPDHAILLDPDGVNTRATAANISALARERGWRRVLAVSHFYHLPRVKMAVGRRGLRVYTVPAEEPRILAKLPYFMLREVAALWVYYLRPLVPVLP
ncbi:MAG: YdcF family protein [Pseudomonadota bacterium]